MEGKIELKEQSFLERVWFRLDMQEIVKWI